jgi:hypothetical protein
MRPVRSVPLAAFLLAAALFVPAGSGARADVLELADGTKLEGKVIQEKDGFVWVRTLGETKKVPKADVKNRVAGKAPVDVLAELEAKIAADPKDVESLWAYYLFCTEHAAESKDLAAKAKPIPGRIVKIAPEHELAREALGEAKFEGKWVKKEDIARLEAEAARRVKKEMHEKNYGVVLEVYDADHWLLLDNTGTKDLARKAKELDEAYRLCGEMLGTERFWDGQAQVLTMKRYTDYLRVLDDSWKKWGMYEWRYTAAKDPKNGGFWQHHPAPFQMRCIPEAKTDGEDGMWAAVVHNAAHVAIWSMKRASEPPAWFEEGVASVVENEVRGYQKAFCVGVSVSDPHKTSDQPKKKGGGNKGLAGEQAVFKEHAKRAIEDNEFPEMRKFLKMKLGDLGPAEVGGAIGLVTWLRAKDPEKFKLLWKEIRSGPKKDDEPWQKSYGWNLIEDMEKDFRVWARTEW